jgi:hypothetical protein
VSESDAASLAYAVRELPARRVSVGKEPMAWEEQRILPESRLFQLFTSIDVQMLLNHVLGLDADKSLHLVCWTSRYRGYEYIPRHRDGAGSAHIVMCLEGRASRHGGELFVRSEHRTHRLALRPGDAVLFDAAGLEHWTKPLPADPLHVGPTRIVAVGRFFALGKRWEAVASGG